MGFPCAWRVLAPACAASPRLAMAEPGWLLNAPSGARAAPVPEPDPACREAQRGPVRFSGVLADRMSARKAHRDVLVAGPGKRHRTALRPARSRRLGPAGSDA